MARAAAGASLAARLWAAVCLALALGLLFSGAAQAAPGIDTWWGDEGGSGGLFSRQPRGVAIGPSGDVYVTDAGESAKQNNRIQRFSGAGTFISAWGKNVDAIAPATGYEICTAADDCKSAEEGALGGELARPGGIAVDPLSGNVYVVDTNNRRVQEFSPAGAFIRAFGKDVVQSGQSGDNPAASAVQTLSVTATGGKYTLEFQGQQTAELPFNANAGEIQAALVALSAIGAGNVEVTGASSPFTIAFKGAHANNPEPAILAAPAVGDPLSGGGAAVTIATPGSSGFEICELASACKAGVSGTEAGAFAGFGTTGGGGAGSGLTVAPLGAPNAGNVLVGDAGNGRVQEFSAGGQFVRAFGWDVVGAGPGNDTAAPANEFEVCAAASFAACKAGATGSGQGQFAAATPTRIAEDKTGRIYTVEPTTNFRVQRFTLPGNVLTPEGEFAAAALHGSIGPILEKKDNTTEIAVDEAGRVYAVKAFPVGTGNPPVVVEAGGMQWQQRVLRLDPASGAVTATMAANPGVVDGATFENATGLAAGAAGTPLYATTAVGTSAVAVPRVWRLNEITGLGASEIRAEEVQASTARLEARITPAAIPLGSAYRFEYSADEVTWTPAPLVDARIGNGSAGGSSTSCPSPPAASCRVAQPIAGLTPNVTYQLRLVVYSLFDKGQAMMLAGQDFRTEAAAPAVRTGVGQWSSPAPTGPSLRLAGTVNPGHDRTTYRFEYVEESTYQADKAGGGSGFEHATRAPAPDGEAGHGLQDVAVAAVIGGLEPTLSYRYRLVAANSVGTREGLVRSVGPPSGGDRFYELVSAGDSWGAGILANLGDISDDGGRASFVTQAFGEEPRSVPGVFNPYLSIRGVGGWEVAETLPGPEEGIASGTKATAADLGAVLWPAATLGEQGRSEGRLLYARIDGSLDSVPLVPRLWRKAGSSEHDTYYVRSASRDLSRTFFDYQGAGAVALLAGEALVADSRSNLYELSGGAATPQIEIVNRADGKAGAVLGGGCGASVAGGPRAVSADGSVVHFYAFPGAAPTSCGSPGPRRLFKRIDGETTVAVSQSQCTRTLPTPCNTATNGDDTYRGASDDGEVAFFLSTRQLVDSDEDTTTDLYLYDADPPAGQPTLAQASAGETVGGHITGKGAKVLGTLDNSEDGSRVYFVAEGVLSGPNVLGKAPVANAKNLYVYERDDAHPTGRMGFVGSLAPGEGVGDEREWKEGEASGKQATALPASGSGDGDGHVLLFISAAKLLAGDTDASKDLYRYTDGAAAPLACLTCLGNGEFEVRVLGRSNASRPDYVQQSRVASTDLATVVFATKEKLTAGDENETWDAYAWEAGTIGLISGGTEGFGIPGGFLQVAISPDGKNVFFTTRAALVGTDTNNAPDLYDARVGGGFPETAAVAGCAGEVSCHGPNVPGEPRPAPPGSEAPGVGNPPAGAKPCGKGKVRKAGRCVKKKHRHHKRADNKRADNKRGGGR